MEVDELKSNPLTESTFYILLALASEPLHGYGIIKKSKGYITKDWTLSCRGFALFNDGKTMVL